MKTRFLTVALVGLVATIAKADYLKWSVDDSIPVNAYALYTGSYGSGTLVEWQDITAGQTSVTFGDFATAAATTTYYVELWTYDNVSYTKAYYSESYGVDALVSAQAYTYANTLQPSSLKAFMPSTAYHAVPEPTSGLLVLMGFAVLGLKRKKV